MTVEYKIAVKRSKRRTASIYIERDGSLSVIVPEKTTEQEIKDILKANEYKIHKYRAKRELLNENLVKRIPVNGQSYLYLGRNYYLQYTENEEKLKLKGRYFTAPASKQNKIKQLFRDFYKKRGKEIILARAKVLAEKMGVELEDVAILELKNRWASCSMKKAKLNFHWKTMMAPISVLEYLIAHELAHFKYRKHDSQFWNEVDKIIPNYQEKVAWLKQYGAALTI